MRRALLAVVVMVLAGCGTGSESGSRPTFPGSEEASGSLPDTFLQIVVDFGDGSRRETWTLVCDGQGDLAHPDGEAACEHLESLEEPFAPLPDDVACTEQYGGPQTAHVVGRWAGEAVDLDLSRTDGCRISQWDGLVPLLPAV